MKKEIKDYVIEQTKNLIDAGSVCKEAKEAATRWLKALDTSEEKAETVKYIAELEEDIETIEDLLLFTRSDLPIKLFGEEKAKLFSAHAEELYKSGAKYCDCPACTACANILAKKDEILN